MGVCTDWRWNAAHAFHRQSVHMDVDGAPAWGCVHANVEDDRPRGQLMVDHRLQLNSGELRRSQTAAGGIGFSLSN
ncbi:hypothetical protein EVAR_3061_1 [Eumeta japonica]|uniref:Uncharacterized protein n=1 Tax=Eumeta variegata TaxID=151549 RepID=A0A4C1SWF1_EUMVA|nr:hypothetical protein EVAR_3061_1 [Eumeta japonica]